MSPFASPNICPALGFVCAGVKVRAAAGLQGQQNRRWLTPSEVKSSSSSKANFPGMVLDGDKASVTCVTASWIRFQALAVARSRGRRRKDWGPGVVRPSCLSQPCCCTRQWPRSSPPVPVQTVQMVRLPSGAASASVCDTAESGQLLLRHLLQRKVQVLSSRSKHFLV